MSYLEFLTNWLPLLRSWLGYPVPICTTCTSQKLLWSKARLDSWHLPHKAMGKIKCVLNLIRVNNSNPRNFISIMTIISSVIFYIVPGQWVINLKSSEVMQRHKEAFVHTSRHNVMVIKTCKGRCIRTTPFGNSQQSVARRQPFLLLSVA